MIDWECEQPISRAIWEAKYRLPGDDTPRDTHARVAAALHPKDSGDRLPLFEAMEERLFVPAGRVLVGAGSGLDVTLFNCFVSPRMQDSMRTEDEGDSSRGIMDVLQVCAFTQQMGGGIGVDFSPLRPRGALVRKRASAAAGPVSFMTMWDGMGESIEAAGARRCAMMATLACWHPDVEEFVLAKRTPGRLTNFNVSVLVTDSFMEAVRLDLPWQLSSEHPRKDGNHLEVVPSPLPGAPRYVYREVRARELWELITRSTYDHAEPGVIFVDRVNAENNLRYCEMISCTNPCGEQPLPPNNACDLGATVLPSFVRDPFGPTPQLDLAGLERAARTGVRALDRVIDASLYPTPEQEEEVRSKRRVGLGVMGLGNALAMLKTRYGSDRSVDLADRIMMTQAVAAYRESVELAKERGPFPLFDRDEFMERPFVKRLPADLREDVARHGVRNGLLLTIAPTGTTSLYAGCVSGGVEPAFDHEMQRAVRQPDDTRRTYEYEDHAYRLYKKIHGLVKVDDLELLPDYMATAMAGLTVDDHLAVQAACQRWVDASISKTINVPEDCSFEDFQGVYLRAHELGLKSCTTYRPNPASGRGAVLTSRKEVEELSDRIVAEAETGRVTVTTRAPRARPPVLPGRTYKERLNGGPAYYITICDAEEGGRRVPHEIFINSKDAEHQEWATALTRLMSAVFRMRPGDVEFVAEELEEVHSARGGGWHGRRHLPGTVAMIGATLRRHLEELGLAGATVNLNPTREELAAAVAAVPVCPRCRSAALRLSEGCRTCDDCGWSNCG